jgi:uncharacterized protein (UPF0332 family)
MRSDFDWREYLELAKALAGMQTAGYSQEAAERSAVSRAYYAAFGCARNYAQNALGFTPQAGSEDHRRLREHFRQQGLLRLASDLNRLRAWRNACDYEQQVAQLSNYVRVGIQLASTIIQACQS